MRLKARSQHVLAVLSAGVILLAGFGYYKFRLEQIQLQEKQQAETQCFRGCGPDKMGILNWSPYHAFHNYTCLCFKKFGSIQGDRAPSPHRIPNAAGVLLEALE